MAKQLRSLLDMTPDTRLKDADAVTSALLGAPANMVTNVNDMETHSGARGIVREDTNGMGLAIVQQDKRDPKFQLAAFADFLLSQSNQFFLSTQASTDRQKRNRAFAAEFLAPIEGIKDRWSPHKSSEANHEAIARDFGVSGFIVQYQVKNQAEYLLVELTTLTRKAMPAVQSISRQAVGPRWSHAPQSRKKCRASKTSCA